MTKQKALAPAKKPARQKPGHDTCPRLRILIGNELILGPGKVDLIEQIGRSGSISAAGRLLGMSYKRAWHLVDTLNRMFPEPVVRLSVGGAHGGGATLTDFGTRVAIAYRKAEQRSASVVKEEFRRIGLDVN